MHPHCEVSTAERGVSSRAAHIRYDVVPNLGNVAALVAALGRAIWRLLGRSIEDGSSSRYARRSFPAFDRVKKAALEAGGLGCSIAGSGPSVFAFAEDGGSANAIGSRDAGRLSFGGTPRFGFV